MTEPINIVFDGPPSHESGRFVEVETDDGRSIKVGEWVERPDGNWALRITALPGQQADECPTDAEQTLRRVERAVAVLDEVAYYQISQEEMLTIIPRGFWRAQVPGHWREAVAKRARPYVEHLTEALYPSPRCPVCDHRVGSHDDGVCGLCGGSCRGLQDVEPRCPTCGCLRRSHNAEGSCDGPCGGTCGLDDLDLDRLLAQKAPEIHQAWDEIAVSHGQRCKAQMDGECVWAYCPQVRDGEPHATGRHCPLDVKDEDARW